MKRIALFQYEWPLLAYTVDVALKLSESGYHVDFFAYNCEKTFIDCGKLTTIENFRLHNFSQSKIVRILWAKLASILNYRYRFKSVSDRAVDKVLSQLKGRKYICYIGIEKRGLIWAGKVAESTKTPLLYYSTELYLEDHPSFKNDENFSKLREEEIFYHQKAIATIIQDISRAEVLLHCNKIDKTDVVYFPVSVQGSLNYKNSDYLYEKLKIEKDKTIILYFGNLTERRYSDKLAEISKKVPDGCTMVLHGFGQKNVIDKLKKHTENDKFILSTDLIPQNLIPDAISSAAIGLVFYEDTSANDRLTVFSSEKVALYLQSRIPIISFDTENYRQLLDACHCGELIAEIEELPRAIQKILSNYDYYRTNAASAFQKYYNFDNNFEHIQNYLDAL